LFSKWFHFLANGIVVVIRHIAFRDKNYSIRFSFSQASSIYLTDLNPVTLDNLQYNASQLNAMDPALVHVQRMDWSDESTWPTESIDFVIGSDLIYQSSIVPRLKKVVLGLLHPSSGVFLYVCPDTGRDGLTEFIAEMKHCGLHCSKEEIAPDAYKSNPLSNGDDEECFLHFHELGTSTYVLYEFSRFES